MWIRILIKLKGRIRIRINVISWIRIHITVICKWQGEMYGKWAYCLYLEGRIRIKVTSRIRIRIRIKVICRIQRLLTLFFSEHHLRHLRNINKLQQELYFTIFLIWVTVESKWRASLELPYAAVPFLDPTRWLQGPLDEIRAEKRQNIMLLTFCYEWTG